MFQRLQLCTRRSMRNESAGNRSNGTRRSYRIYFVVFTFICCIFGPNAAEASYNPTENCTHTAFKVSTIKYQNVSCTNLDLTHVPRDGKEGSDVIKLDLSDNLISSLNLTDLRYFTNLVELIISNNPLSSITEDAFSTLSSLVTLDLSENSLTSLPSGIFEDSNIISLNLSASAYLDFAAPLPKSHAITTLDLSHNAINAVPAALFDSMTALNEVYLNNNQITSLDKDTFEQTTITKIDLSNNMITEIDFKIDRWDSVVSLVLSNNKITDLDSKFLQSSNIQTLDLSFNELQGLTKHHFDKATTLVDLNLSNNELEDLDNDAFEDTTRLISLDLSYNMLTSLDEHYFENAAVLTTLDLSHNSLASLHEDVFSAATELQILYLSHNSLSAIPASIFNGLQDLSEIYLNNNQLTTLPLNVFNDLRAFSLDLSYNSFGCNCDLKDYLYELYHSANQRILNEELLKCTATVVGTATEYNYLDYDTDCDNILGDSCIASNECNARNAECSSLECKCMGSYYDTNDDTKGGKCEGKVRLDYPCPPGKDIACLTGNSTCLNGFCKCIGYFYDDNSPLYLGGECHPKVQNGESCTSNDMCNETHSWCDTSTRKCECSSSYFDSNHLDVGGYCILKLALSAQCNQSYQCASDNSECASSLCTCIAGYKDFDNSGNCKGPSSVVSCFPLNTSNTQVVFQHSSDTPTTDLECANLCYPTGAWYYLRDSSTCLCGTTTTSNDCCPKPSSTQDRCGQYTYVGSSVSRVTAGIVVAPITNAITGTPVQISATTNLTGLIDQMTVSYGDGVVETITGNQFTVQHTYTHADNFNATVSACNTASSVFDRVAITVKVQVPTSNLTTFITTPTYEDASSKLEPYATFSMGNSFKFSWDTKSPGSSSWKSKKGCAAPLILYRGQCINLVTTAKIFDEASTVCTTSAGGHLLELIYQSEISELVTALSLTTSTTPFLTGLKNIGDIVKKTSDNSKSCVTVTGSTTDGDCIAVNPSALTLAWTSCSSALPYVCKEDPVDCPKGGTLQSDKSCLVLGSDSFNGDQKPWQPAEDFCWSNYGGSLVKITSATIQANVTAILGGNLGEVWIGLSDHTTEGYYEWTGPEQTPFNINTDYHPTVTQNSYDCFVTTNTSNWLSYDCEDYKNFVCQYSENYEWVKVQNHIYGDPDLGIQNGDTIGRLVSTSPFTDPTTATTIMLFPELTVTGASTDFTKRLTSLVFQSSSTSMDNQISLLVVRPSCPSGQYLLPSGCGEARFPTCSSTNRACNPITCLSTQKPCSLSETCKFNNETCSCVSNPVSACNNEGNTPILEVTAAIQVSITAANNPFEIPARVAVNELDFVGFQYKSNETPLKCENNQTDVNHQLVLKISQIGWLRSSNILSTVNKTTDDLACDLQMIVADEIEEQLPESLAYAQQNGQGEYKMTIVGVEEKTVAINLQDPITTVGLIHPSPITNTYSDSLGTVYNTLGEAITFTITSDGSDVQAIWSHDANHTTAFTSSCSSVVASAVSAACNVALYCSSTPFTTHSMTPTSTGTMNLTVYLMNSVTTVKKKIEIQTARRVASVTVSLHTSTYTNNTVKLNVPIEFSAVATAGTGLIYTFYINGTQVTSTANLMTHTFSSVNTYQVTVNVSNIVNSVVSSIIIKVKQPTDASSCFFPNSPYTAATGVALSIQLTCSVNIGAEVSNAWYFSSGPSNSTMASKTTTTAATQTWTKSVTFTIAINSVTVIARVMDDFEVVETSTTVVVYNAIPYVNLSISSQKILLNTAVTFTASVPLSLGSYGTVNYTLHRGDGTSTTFPSSSMDNFTYLTAGNYTVRLTATNGPSTVYFVSYVTVYTRITSCSLSSDGTQVINKVVTFTATAVGGTYLTYSFKSANVFDTTQSTNTYSHRFVTANDFTVSVNCSNELSWAEDSMVAIVLRADEIRLTSIKINNSAIPDCIEKGLTHTFLVVAEFYAGLTFDFNWGDGGAILLSRSASQDKVYTTAANVTLVVTAKNSTLSLQKSINTPICVQERISTATIIVGGERGNEPVIGLPASGQTDVNVTVEVVSGTSIMYTWSTNASSQSSLTGTYQLVNVTQPTYYNVSITLTNAINSITVSKVFLVKEVLSIPQISCLQGTLQSNQLFVQKNDNNSYSATFGTGNPDSITWTFGDSSSPVSQTGNPVVYHNYTTIGQYTITIVALDSVTTSVTESLTVNVEDEIVTVTLINWQRNWLNNKVSSTGTTQNLIQNLNIVNAAVFKAEVTPSSMQIQYKFRPQPTASEISSTSNIFTTSYTTTGFKNITVQACNTLNCKMAYFTFYVIKELENITVSEGTSQITATNFYLKANQNHTLTISSDQSVSGTVAYLTIIRTSASALFTSSPTESITFTLPSYDTYTAEFNLENSIGSKKREMTLQVIKTVSGVTITAANGEDGYIARGSSITLTATANEGPYLTVVWLYSSAPSGAVFPTPNTGETITLSPPTVGTYNVTALVSNPVSGNVSATYTIYVIEGVSGVQITAILPYTDAVQAGSTQYTFTAVVDAGQMPLSYAWKSYKNGIAVSQGSQSTLRVAFIEQAIYNISLEVSNNASSVFVSRNVSSLNQVSNFTLQVTIATFKASISSYVAETGSTLNFVSSLSSIQYITLAWRINANSVGSGQTLQHPFTAAGTYIVSLNASNLISSQKKELTILIQTPVASVSVTNCGAAVLINSQVNLTVSYSGGTSAATEWIGQSLSDSQGISVFYRPSATGQFNIIANTSNHVNYVVKVCTMTVQGSVGSLALTASQYKLAGYTITFTVTGSNLINVTYTWTLNGQQKTTNVPTLNHIFSNAGTYNVKVTASNAVSSSNTSISITVTHLLCQEPVLTLEGTSNTVRRTFLRVRNIEVTFSVDTNNCNSYASKNNWTIYSATSCKDPLTSAIALSNTNTPTLRIAPATLSKGSYCFEFTMSYIGTNVAVGKSINVTIDLSDLVAVHKKGEETTSQTIDLDATSSYDPDGLATLAYTWTCTSARASISTNDVCEKVNKVTVAMATIQGSVAADVVFTVGVTVSASGRVSGSAQQKITIVADLHPVLSINLTSSRCVSKTTHVAILGTCESGCTSATTFQWSVSQSNATFAALNPSKTRTSSTIKNLVTKVGALETEITTFKFEATEGSNTGSSLFSLPACTSPSSGTCTVTHSSSKVTFGSLVTVTCLNWQESDTKSSIYYKIMASSTSVVESYIAYFGTKATNQVYIGAVGGGNQGKVDVYVSNDMGVEIFAVSETIDFEYPISDNLDFLVNRISTDLRIISKTSNPMRQVQYIIAALQFLNKLSADYVTDPSLSGTKEARVAVRETLGYGLSGIQSVTLQQLHQLGQAMKYLSKYPEELSLNTLTILGQEINAQSDALKAMVSPGSKQEDYKTGNLIESITQMQTSLQSTTIPVSNGDTLTALGGASSYKLPISRTYPTQTSSNDKRKSDLIHLTLEFGTRLVVVQLQTTVPGESPVVIEKGGNKYIGYNRERDDLVESTGISGAVVNTPQGILDKTTFTGASAYQISASNDVDPRLSLSSSSSATASLPNTKTVQNLFVDPNGNTISVSNLSDTHLIDLFLFNKSVPPYPISSSGLINSANYDPEETVTFQTKSITASIARKIDITMSTIPGTAVAIQIRPQFAATGVLTVQTLRNTVRYTSQDKKITSTTLTGDHRDYTVFISESNADSGASWSLRISSTLETTIKMAVIYHKCLYFTSSNTWSSTGCTVSDTSIAACIHCKCNHQTAYGGSLLVSPDEIRFEDLSEVDIISNPVAIITCSIVLFVYIVALVACRRMDLLDIKRMSNIPLCGKDGSFKYEVTVVTGRQPRAGTSAHVGIRLVGEYGKTGRQHISKDGAFKRNTSDTFVIAYDVNLGELSKILVWHDNSGLSPSWYLSHVIVHDLQTLEKYYFICQSWLSLEQENGSIQREIKVAGVQDMNRFGYRMKTAMFNALADKHLWLSLFNRPALSRFTRVQRATCCVTLLFTFIGINAMWYGLLKKENTELSWGTFGWEEIVLAIVSNVMLFPISLGIVFLFKKSRPKSNMFEHLQKPQTAQTIEIENLCDNSQGGSFESRNIGEVPFDLERESTIDSVPQQAATALHRSRHVRHRENTDDSLATRPRVAVTNTSAKSPLWNQDNIMKWPEATAYNEPDSRPSTSSTIGPTVRQQIVKAGGSKAASGAIAKGKSIKSKEATQQLLDELDDIENELKETESKSVRSSGSKRSVVSSRKASMQKSSSNWGSLEDILNSDDESVAGSGKRMTRSSKRGSVVTTSAGKKFNPRADPRINGNGSHWPKSRESGSTSTGQGESFDHANTAGVTAGLRPGYYSEMTMESRDIRTPSVPKEKCSLPPWCIYIAYILCFLLSVFSVIIVILYCFKFGPDESTEWVLAFLLSFILSIFVIEPFKALLIAVYVVAMFHRVEQEEDEDNINIETTFDNSNEKLKDVKFKPVSGFALLQAKEEGRKIHRMNVMLRQFIAYLFYLWVLMVICYINFKQDTYLLNKYVNNTFVETTTSNYVGYNNISSIDEFWDWSENVLADSLHLQDTSTDEEHGFLLGPARWRLIRSLIDKCKASDAASGLGASTLTDRTCYGDGGFEEDTALYGERWNDSSYNRSWRYFTASQLRGSHKVGYVDTYGGGGYTQDLGTTSAETLTIIQDLKYKGFIDLRTRAIVIEFAMYSPGTDMTAMVAMLVEFPLTGGILTSYEIQSQRLLWFQENRVDPLMVMECILFLVVVYSLVHITLQILEKKKQFFKDVWNWYEMLTTLMTVVSIGIYIGCVAEATSTFNDYLDNPLGFTNFERVAYVHVAMRYLHAWLLFLLMFKVVKQLRFIKFLHVYEKTLRAATGHLLATGIIFGILLLVYAQLGYLMYGRIVAGFETFWQSISTLVVMIRGTFDFWPMLDHHPVFSHFYVYSYYAFTYGIMIALVIAILNSTYKVVKSQMYYKASLEMQDYEMIDFMMKRFKLWAGITKPKPAFRQVRFPGLPSVSSRSSSSYSSRTSSSVQSSHSLPGPELSQMQLNAMLTRLTPTWQAVLKRFDKIEALEKEEENLVKKAEDTMKDLNLRCRINEFERQHKEILNWKEPSSSSSQQGDTSSKQRQSVVKRPPNRDNQTDRKAPATVSGVMSRTAATPPSKEDKVDKERRPLSDQGARAEPATQQRTSTREKVHKFLQSVKPSKPAWSK